MAQISPPRLKTAISSAFTRINFAPPSGISLARSFGSSGSLSTDGDWRWDRKFSYFPQLLAHRLE